MPSVLFQCGWKEGSKPTNLVDKLIGWPHKKLLFDHMMDGFHVLLPKTLAIKLIEYRFFKIMLARLDYEYSQLLLLFRSF